MSMQEKVTITIDPTTGDPSVHAEGFDGKGCLKATADIEKALGSTTSSTPTQEMNRRSTTLAKVRA